MSPSSTSPKEALQKAFDEIKKSEDRLRLVIDTIPTLVWRARPDGVPISSINRRSTTPASHWTKPKLGWPRAFHPDDKKGMLVKWSAIRASGMPGELEARLRRFAANGLRGRSELSVMHRCRRCSGDACRDAADEKLPAAEIHFGYHKDPSIRGCGFLTLVVIN